MPGFYRNPDAVWRDEEGQKELVLKGLEQEAEVDEVGTSIVLLNGTIHSLNILGTEIWRLCDGKTSGEIISELRDIFDADPSVIEADVISFLTELKRMGLVHEK